MHFKLPLLLLATLSLSACSISFFGQEKATRESSLQYTASPEVRNIRVDGFNGDVRVFPSESKEISGTATTFARGGTQAEAARRLGQIHWSFREVGNTLYLELSHPDGGSNNAGSDLTELYVPASWKVDIDTSNGDVDVAKGFQTVLVNTSNGDLKIHCDGKVRLRSSNGDMELSGSTQDFQLSSSNGEITIALDGDWNGSGSAHSSNGKISVRCSGVMDCSLRASTSNGKVKVYGPSLDKGKGSLVLDSSNSGISVTHGK